MTLVSSESKRQRVASGINVDQRFKGADASLIPLLVQSLSWHKTDILFAEVIAANPRILQHRRFAYAQAVGRSGHMFTHSGNCHLRLSDLSAGTWNRVQYVGYGRLLGSLGLTSISLNVPREVVDVLLRRTT